MSVAFDPTWLTALEDPFRRKLLAQPEELPERAAACAEPLRGEPAFDPKQIDALARALPPLPSASAFERPLLERSVRVGLAHIDATFDGDHPKYGVLGYAAPEHDGFPPTIIAAVDALTLWGMADRAERLFSYWLSTFVREDGSIAYYGASLGEYGQLLTTARRLVERGAGADWLAGYRAPLARLAEFAGHAADCEGLPHGVPEADEVEAPAAYFHNSAWLVRGLRDWAALTGEEEAVAERLHRTLLREVRRAWEGNDPWLTPIQDDPDPAPSCATGTRLAGYTNYRYWPELLSSGVLPKTLMRRIVRARLTFGGQFLGMTRIEKHLDDWPLMDHMEGLWALGMVDDYRLCLWGHVLYHQAEGHLTAYEQVTFPPGRKMYDYCLPAQLVAARAVRRLVAS